MQSYDPYASHLQFLKELGTGVRCVLELGSGDYSTRLFLDREYYPDLTCLYVIEPEPAWVAKLPDDPRIVLGHSLNDIFDLTGFDLILIDSGPEGERLSDIAAIAALKLRTRVIIHDFEHMPYQLAALPFQHVQIDRTLTPWTAVCWND